MRLKFRAIDAGREWRLEERLAAQQRLDRRDQDWAVGFNEAEEAVVGLFEGRTRTGEIARAIVIAHHRAPTPISFRGWRAINARTRVHPTVQTCDDADAGTAAEAPQFGEPGIDAPRVWARNILTALVPADADAGSIVAAAADACGLPHHRAA